MEKLEKLFKFGADSAAHLFGQTGYLVPMWVGIDKKSAHIPLIVTNLDDKDRVANTVKEFIKKNGITHYVSMLECWMYEGKELPPEYLTGKSLEDNPDRREAIHILAEDKDGNTISGRFYILRPERGRAKLSPLKVDPPPEKVEGRFVGMFD